MARRFTYPQLRTFVATNPPGSSNEQAALDAIYLLIDDPDLYHGGTQVDAIIATMSPLEIVADRRALPPGPLTDTLTEALARHERGGHEHEHAVPDQPSSAAVEASVPALRPPAREPAATGRAAIAADLVPGVEPQYLASLIDETEARIAAGETDLICEIEPEINPADDDPARQPGDDIEDYYGLDAGDDLDEDLYRARVPERDFGESEARARASLAHARDELADWDRRRSDPARPSPTRESEPPGLSPRQAAALEVDRARRDVGEQEARCYAGTDRHAALDAEYDAQLPEL